MADIRALPGDIPAAEGGVERENGKEADTGKTETTARRHKASPGTGVE